jgi:hypothetical protein
LVTLFLVVEMVLLVANGRLAHDEAPQGVISLQFAGSRDRTENIVAVIPL